MSKPYFHAQSSAKKYGGKWEDYMDVHILLDSSKAAFPNNQHRCLTHNSWFIGVILPKIFGETFRRKSDNKIVNTRDIGEQHVLEDYKMKFIPTPADFLSEMNFTSWMQNGMGEPPYSHRKIHEMIKNESDELTSKVRVIPEVSSDKRMRLDDVSISTGMDLGPTGDMEDLGGVDINSPSLGETVVLDGQASRSGNKSILDSIHKHIDRGSRKGGTFTLD